MPGFRRPSTFLNIVSETVKLIVTNFYIITSLGQKNIILFNLSIYSLSLFNIYTMRETILHTKTVKRKWQKQFYDIS